MAKIKFKAGQSYRADIQFSQPYSSKIYIEHVLPSYYSNLTLVIYRVFGVHKRWWHEFMTTTKRLEQEIERAKTNPYKRKKGGGTIIKKL